MKCIVLGIVIGWASCGASPPASEPPAGEVLVIVLQHVASTEIAETLNRLVEPRPAGAPWPGFCVLYAPGFAAEPREPWCTFLADPARNVLVVRAPAEDMAKIRELVARLDVPADAR